MLFVAEAAMEGIQLVTPIELRPSDKVRKNMQPVISAAESHLYIARLH